METNERKACMVHDVACAVSSAGFFFVGSNSTRRNIPRGRQVFPHQFLIWLFIFWDKRRRKVWWPGSARRLVRACWSKSGRGWCLDAFITVVGWGSCTFCVLHAYTTRVSPLWWHSQPSVMFPLSFLSVLLSIYSIEKRIRVANLLYVLEI